MEGRIGHIFSVDPREGREAMRHGVALGVDLQDGNSPCGEGVGDPALRSDGGGGARRVRLRPGAYRAGATLNHGETSYLNRLKT